MARIQLLNNEFVEFTLSVESTGQESLEAVAQRLELREVRRVIGCYGCLCPGMSTISYAGLSSEVPQRTHFLLSALTCKEAETNFIGVAVLVYCYITASVLWHLQD